MLNLNIHVCIFLEHLQEITMQCNAMLQYKAKDQKVCEKSIKESNLLSKKLNK
jgi:hypothetical protein